MARTQRPDSESIRSCLRADHQVRSDHGSAHHQGGHRADRGWDTSYLNTTAMAALIAGMFTATREVAAWWASSSSPFCCSRVSCATFTSRS